MARSGPTAVAANEDAVAAVRGTLQYVQRYNAHALLAGGAAAAAQGWMQLVEVAFTRQYNALGQGGALPVEQQPAELLYDVLMASLQVWVGGGRGQGGGLHSGTGKGCSEPVYRLGMGFYDRI